VLVTGGAGFIGSHVVDALVAAGHEVAVVDNLRSGRRENLNPRARFHQVDITSPDLAEVVAQERPELINHHAAQSAVRPSLERPDLDATINIVGSLRLLEAARQHGVRRFIYVSSGGAAVGEPAYLPVDEDHPVRPLSPYGASKHTVEHYVELYRALYGLETVVLRYGNVYGPRQDPYGEAGVIAIFASRMLRGEPVTIFGDGDQERDFVYVEDVVAANLAAITGRPGMYNVGTGVGTSVNTIFAELRRLTNYQLPPRHDPPIPGEVYKIYLDCRRAADGLQWTARTSLIEGLARTVDAVRALL